MQKYVNDIATVVDGKLEPLSNASVTVYDRGTTTLATIYSDNGVTTISNPTTSSITGRVEFYAVDGRYDVVVSKTGYYSVTIPDIILDDPISYNAPTSITANDSAAALSISQTGSGPALEVSGPISFGAPVIETASFTVSGTENFIICNGTASITVTLPSAATYPGRVITSKTIEAFTVVSASANVKPKASNTAGTAILAASVGSWATLVSDGTNWVVMAGS